MPNTNVALIGEDELCLAILKKLINQFNPTLCIHYELITRGFGNIKNSIAKFDQASRVVTHIILTDLDRHPCPISLIEDWKVPNNRENLIFRIAVREIEAWLLADRNGFAEFLGIRSQIIHPYPEQIEDPKSLLLQLAGRSRRAGLSKDLVPGKNSTALIGPLYNERLTQFIINSWNPNSASANSESLDRAIRRIEQIGRS